MPWRLVTPPEVAPVSLQVAKDHLRLETVLDDGYVEDLLIPAATSWVEEACRRGLILQSWEKILPCFPACDDSIQLPRGNLSSVEFVKYLDADGVLQTMAEADYEVDTVSVPGRIVLAYGASWPSTRDVWNAVQITFEVGYAAEDLPAPLKQAVLLLVSQMYEHRTPEVMGTIISKVGFAVESLIAPYRLVRFD